jgi:hypothetical protein
MNSISLNHHLAVSVDPELPLSLISSEHLHALHALTKRLPAGLCEFFGFESRLGDARAEVDFLLCAKATEGGREVLAGLTPAQDLPREFFDHPVWQHIRHFALMWAEPATSIHHGVQNIWLEFDVDRQTAGAWSSGTLTLPVPSLFIGTDVLYGHNRHHATPWLLTDVLPLCMGQAVSKELASALSAAVHALPNHANIFQLGMMLGRPGADNMLRLCIRGLNRQETTIYLDTVAWPGEMSDIQEVLDFSHENATDGVDLDIDLCPQIGPKIGLECSFGADRNTPKRLGAFLDHLVKKGMCLASKRDALLAWSRGFHERANPSQWPRDLQARSASAGTPTVSMFMRWVYHIKIVYLPNQPLEAKAYLAVRQAWMTPEFMRQAKIISTQPIN